MNRLKIKEIKQRRHEERRQTALVNAALCSPVERPITYILNNHNRLIHNACHGHRNFEANRVKRVSLALLPRGYKASKLIRRDGSPKNETLDFPQFALSVLPKPSLGPIPLKGKHIKKGGKITTQTLTETEERGRVIFNAVKVISEWTAEEPCFVDPESAYGDRNSRFMDSVMIRLRAFKTAISPNMMQTLKKASIACRRISQNIDVMVNCNSNNGTPFQHNTPTGCSESNTHSALVPEKSPLMSCYSSFTHQIGAARSHVQFRSHGNDDNPLRSSPVILREAYKPAVDQVPQPRLPYLHGLSLINKPLHIQYRREEPDCSRKNNYPVDLDSENQSRYSPCRGIIRNSCNGFQAKWGPPLRHPCTRSNYEIELDSRPLSRWPLYHGLDIEEEAKYPVMRRLNESEYDEIMTRTSLTATLRHPIWDTPDECKTRWSNFAMLK